MKRIVDFQILKIDLPKIPRHIQVIIKGLIKSLLGNLECHYFSRAFIQEVLSKTQNIPTLSE